MTKWLSPKTGFTLPSVMIVSIIMFGVLTLAMRFVSQSASSLRDIYYSQLAREAVESGVAHATECLKGNGYVAQWTNASPLRQNTNCNGAVDGSAPAFIVSGSTVRSSYHIGLPQSNSSGAQQITVVATVELLRSGTSTVWSSYTHSGYANIGATTSFDTVTFGYSGDGAFFGVIDSQGRAMTTGYNGEGQLGNGTIINQTTPVSYQLPSGVKAERMFTNFLSHGRYLFVKGSDGNLYAAGRNVDGELGIGRYSTYEATPQRVSLPAGFKTRSVAVTTGNAYFVGQDSLGNHRIYATGLCRQGALGNGSTCTNTSTPVMVSMPTPTSDLTRPVLDSDWTQSTNITTDRPSVFVRTIGGRVYGWGLNDHGQMGTGNTTDRTTPVQIGTFGNTGQPKAKQLAFDGGTLYIVTDTGRLFVVGRASQGYLTSGMLLGAPARLKYRATPTQCLTSNGANNGYSLTACSSSASQLFTLRPDGRIADSNGVCMAALAATTGGSDTRIMGANCTNSSTQLLWTLGADGRIRNNSTGTCLDMATPTYSYTQGCYSTRVQWQEFNIDDTAIVREVPLPEGTKAVRVTTDQRSTLVLLDNGEVWGGGANDSGQLGISGNAWSAVTKLTKMSLPAGRTATDVYTTMAGTHTSANQYANTFVVLDNGRVVGAGSNHLNNLGNCSYATSTFQTAPRYMNLPAGVRAKTVQAGLGTSVVLTESGQIYTVGNNEHGQLGDGATVSKCVPGAHRYVNVLPPVIF